MRDKHGDEVRLHHILDAISKIRAYVEDETQESFSSNSKTIDACLRQLQIVGEACNKLSKSLREDNNQIPWRQIIGLRIIIVHQYFGVDDNIIWDVIQNDLPPLSDQIQMILSGLQ